MPLPPLTPERWFTGWSLDLPALVVVTVLGVAYVLLARRVPDWPATRLRSFLLGLAGVLVVTCSFLGTYAHTVFWVLAAQDVLLLMLVPIPLAMSRPVRLLTQARGSTRSVSFQVPPLVGSLLVSGLLLAVYTTGWDLARLERPWLMELTRVLLVVTGGAFLGGLLGESRTSYGARTFVAFLDGLLDAVPGLVVLGHHGLVAGAWYVSHPRPWGPSAAADQQLGGTAMVALAELVGLPALLVLLVGWARADDDEARAVDARMDVLAAARAVVDGEPDGVPVLERPWWERDAGPLADRFRTRDP